jgi:hypothetical protein
VRIRAVAGDRACGFPTRKGLEQSETAGVPLSFLLFVLFSFVIPFSVSFVTFFGEKERFISDFRFASCEVDFVYVKV